MPKYLVMPKIGMNMVEGVITRWLISPGDHVEKEQVILESETDKAVQEIVATETGIVHELLVNEGDVVPCQSKIAILLDDDEEAPPSSQTLSSDNILLLRNHLNLEESAEKSILENEKTDFKVSVPRIKISPLAKKTAIDLGIGIDELRPRQEGLRITKSDVLNYYQNKKSVNIAVSQENEIEPKSDFKRSIVTLQGTIDAEELWSFEEILSEKFQVSLDALILKICAVALKRHPRVNALCVGGDVKVINEVNIGLAIESENGLTVPVLRHVDWKGIYELAEEVNDLRGKAHINQLTNKDVAQGTFTIINLGMFEVESFNPIMFGHQCAILGMGMIKKIPVIRDDEFAIRKSMQISLSFDRTCIDEMSAANFFKEIKTFMAYPLYMVA